MAKKGAAKENKAPATINNRRARFDYEILDSFEAGIALVGSEVKSVYLGRAHLTDAFCRVLRREMLLINFDIEPYDKAGSFAPERRRDRKLLLHRKEIETIDRKSMEKGLTIVPTRVYFKNGRVKVEIALARGKAQYDKRHKLAQDEERREMERVRSERL